MYDIAIWTPINSESGFGHFYRMFGFYEALTKNNLSVSYFTNQEFLNLENVDILSVITDDIEKIKLFLISHSIKTLIIDNYQIDKKSILYLKNYFKIVYFDASFENIDVDIILNFNPYSINKYPMKHTDTKYFLGLEYMKFRNSICKADKREVLRNSIFISIGGSDILNITYKMIPYLLQENFYNIVLGKGCSVDYYNQVLERLNQLKLNFKLFHQPSNYFEILLESEKAIISCSTTSYELIYFSKPFICINIINNQNEITKYLNTNGINTLTEEKLNKIFEIIKEDKFALPSNLAYVDNSEQLISEIKRLNNE